MTLCRQKVGASRVLEVLRGNRTLLDKMRFASLVGTAIAVVCRAALEQDQCIEILHNIQPPRDD